MSLYFVDTLEQLQHEHLLELVDLQPKYPGYKEYEEKDDDDDDDGDDEDDDDTKWDFCSPCNLCGKEVNLYQRYYYKCSRNSCDYLLHKWCRELPTTISRRSYHNHSQCSDGTLVLGNATEWKCEICQTWRYKPNESLYRCRSCSLCVDIQCVMGSIQNQTIYHPSHPHPLIRATTGHKPISYHCDACGKEHMGHLYICPTCFDFCVQSDCLLLSKKKPTTQHTHPLILSYSFPWEHQKAEFFPKCRICSKDFKHSVALWIYKCEKCRYYVHLDCIKSKGGQFISETGKDYEESDYPNILNLPFSDQTDSIQKHLFFKELLTSSTPINVEINLLQLTHNNCHQHPLRVVHHSDNHVSNTSSIISCHNPREKIELLCDGCVRPITSTPFYQCKDCPSFVLHEWCTRLPLELRNHYGHPDHTLTLLPKVPFSNFGVFYCHVCRFPCNGFAYGCERCNYYIDVTCGFMPQVITHEAHPNHLFFRVDRRQSHGMCLACLESCHLRSFSYKCRTCKGIYLHPECALLLPKTITHKYDKHPMKLSYMPVENHKSEYFCEICEEKFDPKRWFYHCSAKECAQSLHPACAPVILQSERETHSLERGVYEFVNIKFGRVVDGNFVEGGHSHSDSDSDSVLIFAQGIHDDGGCVKCGKSVRYHMVFKCLQCKFVIHYQCVVFKK